MRTWAIMLVLLASGGCAVAPQQADTGGFFSDALFRAPSEPIDATAVLAANEAMKRYVATEIGDLHGPKGRQRTLIDALRSKGRLQLEYDGTFTRNAAEAFDARTGNCLSLVIMTAALAREADIGVQYQNVYVEETWSRQGALYFSIGHVNLTLGRNPPKLGSRIDDGEQLIVDFLPPPDLRRTTWRVIGEKTILAMYMNNRAAESLAAGKVDDAYWFAREAVRQDPEFMTPYNTLGVIYQRRNHFGEAARILAYALDREPRNTHVMSNLAPVLASLGRATEAQALANRLAQLEPDPPFAYFNRGVEAMRAGDFRTARDLFARELDRSPNYHEFHFWLALALANLGEAEKAKQHLALAMESSTTKKDHDLYSAKLDRFRTARQP